MLKTKEQIIRKFIKEFNPTSKEMRYMCLIADPSKKFEEQTKKVFEDTKDKTYAQLKINGFYSNNITDWINSGNIELVDGKYKLTENCLKNNNSLYVMTKDALISILRKRLRSALESRNDYWYKYRELKSNLNYIYNSLDLIKSELEPKIN